MTTTYGQHGVVRVSSGPLLNTAKTPFVALGPTETEVEWPGVEWFFQAWKTTNVELAERIRSSPTWRIAKRIGRQVELRSGWDSGPLREQKRIRVMKAGMLYKFRRHEDLLSLLVQTGHRTIVEDASGWGDMFWGAVHGKGENWTGRLLMEVRAELGPQEVLPF